MATKTLKTVPKISVKIWRPIIEKLDQKIETACLRRDAYLAKVLETELDWLDQEVSIPNSKASYDYVFERLDQLDRKLVSLALPPELTQRLNEICAHKRIVRDAFFNRVFLLLAASPKVVDTLLFADNASRWRTEVWSENKHDGPFFRIRTRIGCHSFRATGITEYLRDGGKLEIAQQMANHESARTTGLYDRRTDQINLDEVERIVI